MSICTFFLLIFKNGHQISTVFSARGGTNRKQIFKKNGGNITKINKENVERIHISGKRPHNNLERHKPTPSLTLPDPHASLVVSPGAHLRAYI